MGEATTTAKVLNGAPIKVGFFDPDQGVQAKPAPKQGMEAATARIDATGINGSPIEIIDCSTSQTPESDIACGNKFVQEHVVAAFDGSDFSAGAALPILHSAKIPMTGWSPFAPEAEVDTSSYYFTAGQTVTAATWFKSFKKQGPKKITFVASDNSGTHGFFESVLIPMAKAEGIELSPVYYNAASPNFTAMAAAVAATDPEMGGSIGLHERAGMHAVREGASRLLLRRADLRRRLLAVHPGTRAGSGGRPDRERDLAPGHEEHAPAEVEKQMTEAEAEMSKVTNPEEAGIFAWNT